MQLSSLILVLQASCGRAARLARAGGRRGDAADLEVRCGTENHTGRANRREPCYTVACKSHRLGGQAGRSAAGRGSAGGNGTQTVSIGASNRGRPRRRRQAGFRPSARYVQPSSAGECRGGAFGLALGAEAIGPCGAPSAAATRNTYSYQQASPPASPPQTAAVFNQHAVEVLLRAVVPQGGAQPSRTWFSLCRNTASCRFDASCLPNALAPAIPP